ncbi:MAG: hypothetical protein JO279_00095 [Verrucomicrobia bacterium]|nr:hypothetical protein [Verrucomicrobiota bacterium]
MMKTLIEIAVPAMTIVLLTAVGLDLRAGDFVRVRRQPAVLLVGVIAPAILLPLLAFGLTLLFQTGPGVTAGVLLIAACPIGGISNAYVYLARASVALSVTLSGLSCLCASLTIPLIGKWLKLITGRPLDVAAPMRLQIAQLVVMLALPLTLGIWLRQRAPEFAARYHAALQRLAFMALTVVLFLVIAEDPNAFVGGLSKTVPIAVAFVLSSLIVGWMVAAPVTRNRGDRFTVAVEFGTRNVSIATAIAVTLLGRIDFARFATTYFLTEVPLMLLAVFAFRRVQALLSTQAVASGPKQ